MLQSAKCFQSATGVHRHHHFRHGSGRNSWFSFTSQRSLRSDALSNAVHYPHCPVLKNKSVRLGVGVASCASHSWHYLVCPFGKICFCWIDFCQAEVCLAAAGGWIWDFVSRNNRGFSWKETRFLIVGWKTLTLSYFRSDNLSRGSFLLEFNLFVLMDF